MPERYRQVSVAAVPSLDPDELVARFTGREAYRRTRFVIARLDGRPERCALVELARDGSDELFSPARAARVLVGAEECAYVRDDRVDPGIASHMAGAATHCPDRRAVVVEGRYSHVSFILNADPIPVTVVDVVPPAPSKLADQVERILDSAEDLPPIVVSAVAVDSRELVAEADPAPSVGVLVPCRGGGVDIDGVAVSYLDERPERSDWALLGCERSQQIHRWFYGDEPVQVIDWCPRRLIESAGAAGIGGITSGGSASGTDESAAAAGTTGLVLSRCCILEEGVEQHGGTALVPWGATLGEVRHALDLLVDTWDCSWTRV